MSFTTVSDRFALICWRHGKMGDAFHAV